MHLLRFGFLSILGSWTRHFTLAMWKSTGNTQTTGVHKGSCLGKSFSLFCSKSCWYRCRTNLFSNRIKEKIGPIGICLHKSELKHFLQAKSEDIQAQLKQKWDNHQNGLFGCSSPSKLLKQNNVAPYTACCGTIEGAPGRKSSRCNILSFQIIFFFFSQPKEDKVMWDQSPL